MKSAARGPRFWRNWENEYGPSGAGFLAALAFLALIGLIYLVVADNPWQPKIQERLAAGKRLHPGQFGSIGLWWAAMANSGIAIALIFTARWWLNSQGSVALLRLDPRSVAKVPKRICMMILLFIAIYAVVVRSYRMNDSYWNDEEYSIRNYVHGVHKAGGAGDFEFDAATWDETFFYNRHGNNHLAHTIPTRLVLKLWRTMAGAADDEFSEAATRVLPVLNSLIAIGGAFWLGLLLRGWIGGVSSAAFLAFCPWYFRYSVEARGYSGTVCFVVLALCFLIKALSTNRLRWWIAYAVAQALYFTYFYGSGYVVLAMNFMVGIHLLSHRDEDGNRVAAMLPRFIAVNFISAMLVLPLFLPAVKQVLDFVAEKTGTGVFTYDLWYLRELWGLVWTSSSWRALEPNEHLGTSVQQLIGNHSVRFWLLAGVLPALVVFGGFRASRSWAGRIALCCVPATLLGFLHARIGETDLYPWYLIFLVVSVLVAVAYAFDALWGLASSSNVVRRSMGYTLMALLSWFSFDLMHESISIMNGNDRQKIRQIITRIRGDFSNPDARPELVTVTFGTSARQALLYDPKVQIVKSAPELEHLMEESKQSKTELVVYHCGKKLADRSLKDIMAIVRNRKKFKKIGEEQGLEELFSYHYYRMQEK